MKQLKYGFYGEDDAHKIFLQNYLSHFVETVFFERDEVFCEKFRATNRKQVDTKFAIVARTGLGWYQHEAFFVVRDVDSLHPSEFDERYTHFLKEKIDKLLIALPVQCIEHWLWYLKHKKDNPDLTKNISLESQPRKKVKFILYGYEDPPNEISNPIVNGLSKSFDASWLEQRSESFKHFHSQVKAFINKLV
ncbi:hypothetical protein [Spirosoma sp.]|uniref:hypothetical protein n=1 Tax=Spirosoma sp. TaxID=1899569 RepID=UPI00261293EE|nr:hypothetical protein [Spirosoma sp.]MCX6213288.1 hypothetical protein [Spirosoma sp.]